MGAYVVIPPLRPMWMTSLQDHLPVFHPPSVRCPILPILIYLISLLLGIPLSAVRSKNFFHTFRTSSFTGNLDLVVWLLWWECMMSPPFRLSDVDALSASPTLDLSPTFCTSSDPSYSDLSDLPTVGHSPRSRVQKTTYFLYGVPRW